MWAGRPGEAEASYLEAAEISTSIGVPAPATTGALAKESSCYVISGRSSRKSIEISVSYTTQTGAHYWRNLDTFSFLEPDQKKTCVVRYDPAAPTHVTASWGFQIIFSRTLIMILVFVMGAGGLVSAGNALVVGIGRRLGWVRPPSEKSSQAAGGTAAKSNEVSARD